MPALGPSNMQETPDGLMRQIRLLAIAATALALGLTGWRTLETLTQPATTSNIGSAYEQELVALIEPVTGRGAARLKLHRNEAGSRNFLILIDGAEVSVSPHMVRLEALLVSAAGLNLAAGDTLDIQQFPFAKSVSPRPSQAEIAELAGLGLLTLLLGFMAFTPGRVQIASRSMPMRADIEPSSRLRPMVPELNEEQSLSRVAEVSSEVSRDPAAAATILRRWMRGEETAA